MSILRLLVILLCCACSMHLLAAEALDPYKTTIPIYRLSASAAADGNLAEWAGIPAFGAANFRLGAQTAVDPSDSFTPGLRFGMKKGSNDLYVLITVHDPQRYAEDRMTWIAGDYVEFFMDYGRAERDAANPDWVKKDLAVPKGMGQCGLKPRTLVGPQRIAFATAAQHWKIDYVSTLIEGGIAYELRIDGQSVLDDLQMKELPPYMGIDVGLMDQDYMIMLSMAGWSNDSGSYRLFGNFMDHAFPNHYGMLSLRPIDPPKAAKVDPRPKTLQELYAEMPTGATIKKNIGKLAPEKLADLVYWAGLQGAEFDTALVKQLMAMDSAPVRESMLTVLYFTDQGAAAVKTAVMPVYADVAHQSPFVLTLANLLNQQFKLGYRLPLRELINSKDPTVAFTAARALEQVGVLDDASYLEQSLAAITAGLPKDSNLKGPYTVYFGASIDALRARLETVTIPTCTAVRELKKANTDLPRFMPLDGNHVYNAAGLLRRWPKTGPKELWRLEVGQGKSAVVEGGGKAYIVAEADKQVYAICHDAASGAVVWKQAVKGNPNGGMGPVPSPMLDGDRLYMVPGQVGTPLVCLNTKDGTELWRSTQGIANCSSPLLVGDTVYMPTADGNAPLVALDKMTGKLRWKTPPSRGGGGSPAAPIYQIIDGIPQVVFGAGSGSTSDVWGVNANTGELFWRYALGTDWGLVPSAVAVDARIFFVEGRGPVAVCLQMFVKDGKIKAHPLYRNERILRNLNGAVAIWQKAVYGFCGPTMQCVNLADGVILWKKEGKDWASDQQLIVADGLIFATTTGGDLVMAEANRTGYKELGRVAINADLGERQQPTLANGRLYLRANRWVICYQVSPTLLGSEGDSGVLVK